MKNIILFTLIFFAVIWGSVSAAGETFDMEELAEVSEWSGEIEWSGEMIVWKMEQEAPLKIWKSKVLAHPNTFIWYRWRDYDAAGAWQKPLIFEELRKLLNQ